MPGRQVALTIELEPEMVSGALDRAYRQMVNQVNVPGFRRGKAPRQILERYVGEEALTERAVRNILPQALQDAIAEQKLEALDVSDFEIVSMSPLQVKVVVVQPPLVELGDYGSIRVEKEQAEITGSQVDEVISELRRESAPWNEPAEARPIKEGDMVYLDLEGFTTEGEIEAARRENFPTIVGVARGGVPEAVNKALEGMSVDEEKDVTETLPEDYPVEELRGKDASYHVKVLSIKEQQLPEINDEFAKKVGFDTVELMREAIDRNLRQRSEESAETAQVDKIIEQIMAGSRVEVPDVMVNEELDDMLKSLENRLKEQRVNLRQYFTYGGMNEQEWREANLERARERVIRSLALHEFSHREGVEVEEGEVEREIETMLDRFEEAERDKAREVFGAEDMRSSLQNQVYQRKLVDRLVGIAEGRIEAAAPHTHDEDGAEAESGSPEDATALADAGGAAEVLGTGEVDRESPNETGKAEGGGTPATAPGLEAQDAQAQT
jgi:trigger factor